MISIIIGILVGVTHLLGYWTYYRISSLHKETSPNTASWSIWAFGSVVNLLTYSSMSNDWVKDILPAVCSFCCTVVFVGYLRQGKFKKIKLVDVFVFLIVIIAIVIWQVVDSPMIGNMACQLGTVLSFYPIIRETLKDPKREKPLAWTIWSCAYGLDIVLVIMRWNQWGDMAYPATCFVLHVLMAIISTKRRSPQ